LSPNDSTPPCSYFNFLSLVSFASINLFVWFLLTFNRRSHSRCLLSCCRLIHSSCIACRWGCNWQVNFCQVVAKEQKDDRDDDQVDKFELFARRSIVVLPVPIREGSRSWCTTSNCSWLAHRLSFLRNLGLDLIEFFFFLLDHHFVGLDLLLSLATIAYCWLIHRALTFIFGWLIEFSRFLEFLDRLGWSICWWLNHRDKVILIVGRTGGWIGWASGCCFGHAHGELHGLDHGLLQELVEVGQLTCLAAFQLRVGHLHLELRITCRTNSLKGKRRR
jgi:hypothetical protein